MTIVDIVGRNIASPVNRPIISVGGFKPTDISDLRLWLDASDASTLTLRSGVYVEEWRDKSGQGNHFSQATEARQPSWGANEVNFAAILANMTAGGNYIFSESDGLSIIALAKSATTGGLSRFVFDFGRFGTAGYGMHFNQVYLAGYVPFYPKGGTAAVGSDYRRISSVIEFSASQKLYLDNIEKFSDAIPTPYLTAANIAESPTQVDDVSGPMTIGKMSSNDVSRAFSGTMKSVLIYGKKLTTQERTALDSYLAAIP